MVIILPLGGSRTHPPATMNKPRQVKDAIQWSLIVRMNNVFFAEKLMLRISTNIFKNSSVFSIRQLKKYRIEPSLIG
jgi:hypothetical protein